MSFIDDIKNMLNVEDGFFKAVMIGDGGIYFEGVVSVDSFSPEEIIIKAKKFSLKLTGSQLYIKKFCLGDLVVCGTIRSLSKI